ncbi:unnamed protein product [Didymodactylos carnosus]|uniref:Uncharacterized protein n=1 Tax=Didymodactylos carnosus TaxID=1234261 RepID=A0A814PZJ9_9BILA|nr:unnamed protein product [Didymodactylos carnosus]CAF3876662.1 unnamed protein product [Didymodactylos carnosus]
MVCLVIFGLIRSIGGTIGNYRGWSRGERVDSFMLAFLDVCKYPPSFAYATMTLSGCSFLCVIFDLLVNKAIRSTERLNDNVSVRQNAQEQENQNHVVRGFLSIQVANVTSIDTDTVNKGNLSSSKTRCLFYFGSPFSREFPFWPFWGRYILYPLLTIGRVPLFFYIVHWYLLGLGAIIVHSFTTGLPLKYVPIWWFGLIIVMLFLCVPYSRFKEKQGPDSLWRFL